MTDYIPEDLKQMIKEIVAIEELEKMAKENEEQFYRDGLLIDEFIEELKEADHIDPELWKREITI